jgi:hypothetical protein
MSGSAVFRANPVIIYHIIAPRTSEKLFAERLAPFPRKKRRNPVPLLVSLFFLVYGSMYAIVLRAFFRAMSGFCARARGFRSPGGAF